MRGEGDDEFENFGVTAAEIKVEWFINNNSLQPVVLAHLWCYIVLLQWIGVVSNTAEAGKFQQLLIFRRCCWNMKPPDVTFNLDLLV